MSVRLSVCMYVLDRANEEYKERQLSVHDPVFCPIISLGFRNLNAPLSRREDRSGGLGPSKAAILEMLTTIRIAIYRIKFRLNLSL